MTNLLLRSLALARNDESLVILIPSRAQVAWEGMRFFAKKMLCLRLGMTNASHT